MKNKKYCFLVENSDLNSFLSFCKVNKIDCNEELFSGELTYLLEGNKVKTIELSDDEDCDDWDDFIRKYYLDLTDNMSNKDIINKFKSNGYSYSKRCLIYGDLSICADYILGLWDKLHYDLLEIIFESNQPISSPKSSIDSPTQSKSYLDFNPLN